MKGPVVVNASPLIGLAAIGRLDLLRALWDRAVIPEAVYREVVVTGAGRPGAGPVRDACDRWLDVKAVRDRQEVAALRAVLDEGEAEVLVLGQELGAGLLLLDNREPRVFAKALQLKVMGTLGVLRLGWLKGMVEGPVAEVLRLRHRGFWIADRLVEALRADLAAGDR